ncbi:MAG: DUF1295 domain-containing protein [Planctomycetaceae bacterium]|nr:DUF1295 domain-containing protein [Planctomycetaceae bacterium]
MGTVLTSTGVLVVFLMFITWLVSLRINDVSIIDAVWGTGFVLIAWTSWFLKTRSADAVLPAVLTTVWGLRLSAYLAWRNHGRPEDPRYAAMRRRHGKRFAITSLMTVFALQGAVMWMVSLPLQFSSKLHSDRGTVVLVGILFWVTGLSFEAAADFQLARFRSRRSAPDELLTSGLWRYTRHPNYFGDFCVWWGLFFSATGFGTPWWCIFSPILMSWLLMKVSGVALLESALGSTKPGYTRYVKSTNAFFPWFPRTDG